MSSFNFKFPAPFCFALKIDSFVTGLAVKDCVNNLCGVSYAAGQFAESAVDL